MATERRKTVFDDVMMDRSEAFVMMTCGEMSIVTMPISRVAPQCVAGQNDPMSQSVVHAGLLHVPVMMSAHDAARSAIDVLAWRFRRGCRGH